MRSETEQDAAAVGWVRLAMDQASLLAAVAEFDYAVMAKRQPFCKIADGDEGSVGRASDLEQQLMLLRCDANCGGGFLAEVEETSQGVAKFRQGADVRIGQNIFCRRKRHIIYRSTIRMVDSPRLTQLQMRRPNFCAAMYRPECLERTSAWN